MNETIWNCFKRHKWSVASHEYLLGLVVLMNCSYDVTLKVMHWNPYETYVAVEANFYKGPSRDECCKLV